MIRTFVVTPILRWEQLSTEARSLSLSRGSNHFTLGRGGGRTEVEASWHDVIGRSWLLGWLTLILSLRGTNMGQIRV